MHFNENLLRSWLEFINLEDKAAAEIDRKNIFEGNLKEINKKLKLKGDRLYINAKTAFDKIKDTVRENSNSNRGSLSLSFPSVYIKEGSTEKLKPLFVIDIESIFRGDYSENGWDLTGLEFVPSSTNIQDILQLDDEELNNIGAGAELSDFISTTFNIKAGTMEEMASRLASELKQINKKIFTRPAPYIFEYQGEHFNANLKRDFLRIINKNKITLSQKNLLTTYISNKDYAEKELFFGALGDFPPTDSQAQVIYSSIKNTIVAAQGPPGSGKTTLIVNIVANQVVKSALSLIEGKDRNCLTVITSTNNRAVDNAIEKIIELDKEQSNWDLCLAGGNSEKINQYTIKAIYKKIDFLKTEDFDEEKYERLKDEITCNYREIQAKIKEFYDLIDRIKKLEGDITENKNLFDKQKEKVDRTRLKLENDIKDFFGQESPVGYSDLNNINGDTYYKIKDLLTKYHNSFPRFFDFFGWRSRRHLNKLNVQLEPLLEKTYNNPPGLRMSLVEDEAALISLKDKADRICLLVDALREFMGISKQLDNLKSELDNLDKQLDNKKQEVREWLKKITSGKLSEEKIDACLTKITFERNDIFKIYHEIFFNENLELFRLCKGFLLQHVLKNKNTYIDTLEKYVKLITREGDNRGVFNEVLIDVEGFYRNLSKVFPVFGSTLQSVSNMFKFTTPNLIDKVIVDEAGMVKCYQVVPLFFRANSAVVVGDPLQIPPVIAHGERMLEAYEEHAFLKDYFKDNNVDDATVKMYISSYSPSSEKATAYHLAATCNFQGATLQEKYHEIRLKEHFRCQKDIADYFNDICGYGLTVKTRKKTPLLGTNLVAYHVEGKMEGKVNVEEIEAIKHIIRHLIKHGYRIGGAPDSGIGVISPYRVHCNRLRQELCEEFEEFKNNKDRIGTIHTFQGGEKDVIICSTRIFSKKHSAHFINKWPNILNVAVSRAKELFILVGNLDKLRSSGGYTNKLVEHIESRGEILEWNERPAGIAKWQKDPNVVIISDCKHIKIFDEAIDECKKELLIVSPWIRGAAKHLINKLANKNIKTTIIFGWRQDDVNDEQVLERLRKMPNVNLIDSRTTGEGTHEKIVICDRKFAVIGSWNWLSHKYYKRCVMKQANEKLVVRHEISAKICDHNKIEQLYNQLLKRYSG
jgi:hypothetical protein